MTKYEWEFVLRHFFWGDELRKALTVQMLRFLDPSFLLLLAPRHTYIALQNQLCSLWQCCAVFESCPSLRLEYSRLVVQTTIVAENKADEHRHLASQHKQRKGVFDLQNRMEW